MYEFTLKDDAGDTLRVIADSRDVLHWEREKSGRSAAKLASDWHMEDFYSLAHLAATRTGQFRGRLIDFENTYRVTRTAEVLDDDTGHADEGGPTQPDRSTGT